MSPAKPRVFVNADVIFAGAASPNEHSASNVILRMAELTLITAVTSVQAITEVERSLAEKMPKALPAFRLLSSRCLLVVADPDPETLRAYVGLADPEDLLLLATAVESGCSMLATDNLRHFRPGHPSVAVLRPGDMVLRVRTLLARLGE